MILFAQPEAFYLIIIGLVVFSALVLREVRGQRNIGRELAVYQYGIRRKTFLKLLFVLIVFLPLVFLLAGPGARKDIYQGGVSSRMLLMFDNTISMEARRVIDSSSRFERSKEIARRILDDIHFVKVGVCVFGSTISCPIPPSGMQKDRRVLEIVVEDFVAEGHIHGKGSDLVASLRDLARFVDKQSGPKSPLLVVVFTDGEQTDEAPLPADTLELRDADIKFVFVGVGEINGAKIPIRNRETGEIYKSYRYDPRTRSDYVSFLDEGYLKSLAAGLDGEYFFEDERKDLIRFIKANLPETRNPDEEEDQDRLYENMFHLSIIPLASLMFVVFVRRYIF